MSLIVGGQGTVTLKAGDGTPFDLLNCLWVPELSRNLIAGGLLKIKGVREVYDPSDSSNFALVKGNLALLNGYIGNDNLMHVQITPVSNHSSTMNAHSTNVSPSLIHRRLGHVSDRYLKLMCKHESVDGEMDLENLGECKCEICLLSKGTKIPHNHT